MELASEPGVTSMLKQLDGDRKGEFAALVDAVYADIRGIAAKRMHDRFGYELGGLTLQPTALANDVIMELLKQRQQFVNRQQFFAVATMITMRLLVSYQRHRLAGKRGGGKRGGEGGLDAVGRGGEPKGEELGESTLKALEELHRLDARKAEVVTLHVLCGMPLPKVAELVDTSLPTVERDWRFAKNWLATRLEGEVSQ